MGNTCSVCGVESDVDPKGEKPGKRKKRNGQQPEFNESPIADKNPTVTSTFCTPIADTPANEFSARPKCEALGLAELPTIDLSPKQQKVDLPDGQPPSKIEPPSPTEVHNNRHGYTARYVTCIMDAIKDNGYELRIYDIVKEKFITSNLKTEVSINQGHSIVSGSSMYIICTGDYDTLTRNVFEVPLNTNDGPQMIPCASIHYARMSPELAQYAGKYIYVVGGSSQQDDVRACEKYDIKKNVWTMFPSIEADVWVSRAFNLGHYIYLAKTSSEEQRKTCEWLYALDRLDVLDEEMGWINICYFPDTMSSGSICTWHGMAQIAQNTILFFGGILSVILLHR